jgi:hypothetical protein
MKIVDDIISLMLRKYTFPEFIFKKLPNNWTDKIGNNLFHYAAFQLIKLVKSLFQEDLILMIKH